MPDCPVSISSVWLKMWSCSPSVVPAGIRIAVPGGNISSFVPTPDA
jgi:hypothetical protein